MSDNKTLGFVAWDAGSWSFVHWEWGRVTKRTDKTITVEQWSDYGGGRFGAATRKSIIPDMVFFDNEADARALAKAMKDLRDRENDTRRQYAEKRKALVEAARSKGGAE